MRLQESRYFDFSGFYVDRLTNVVGSNIDSRLLRVLQGVSLEMLFSKNGKIEINEIKLSKLMMLSKILGEFRIQPRIVYGSKNLYSQNVKKEKRFCSHNRAKLFSCFALWKLLRDC